jgi:hypothetical protein
MEDHGGLHGPRLRFAMFDRRTYPDPHAAADFAGRARSAWRRLRERSE